ncbi:MAG: response regulator [Oscillospiraceae bacterium]|nr:response regulator [Oscillospiraceae bacterium]
MRIIVVDDEELVLEGEIRLIRECAPEATVRGFRSPQNALDYLKTCAADVAFVDFEMPQCHGLVLAKQMKALCPQINIIFATAYRDYYADAINLRASGYLLKPLHEERIKEELDNLRYPVETGKRGLYARAFGNFEVFYNGQPMMFRYHKTKELLAYLIDRRGALVSRDELVTALWGGEHEHSSYFKQLQKDLRDTFAGFDCADLLIKQKGAIGVLAGKIACDYYDWLEGLPEGLNAYHGEYMRQYSWAESTRLSLEGDSHIWE